MQKLIKNQFFCYPKKQKLSIIYKDIDCLNSRLFNSLSTQISPKNGFLQRLRKSKFGHFLSNLLTSNKIEISFLDSKNVKIGYKNNSKVVLFGFDEENNPVEVYKKNGKGLWDKTSFLGYTLIEKYTKEEYFNKRESIAIALKKRWKEILSGKDLHGDFTHFNILLSPNNIPKFIDDNTCENSKLFDHFYFYSYYLQSLKRCKTISKKDVLEIKINLQSLIKNICSSEDLKGLLSSINTKAAYGLFPLEKEKMKIEFTNFLLSNER
jgi:hypothetical protein